MDLKQLKELISLVEKSKIKKLSIKEKSGTEISIEKESDYDPSIDLTLASKQALASLHHVPGGHFPATSEKPVSKEDTPSSNEETGTYITSPMVGSFYRSPAPGEPPFVQIGDKVDKDTIVCIIEAMKVMNEVKAGASGVIKEVLSENGNAVEFGTKLFRIE